MSRKGFVWIAFLALVLVLVQATKILAGTTGALSGSVLRSDGAPVAGAKVTATSPSQTSSTTTDAAGHFTFVSLIPDTYSVTASKDGYDTVSQAGVSVFADNTQVVRLTTQLTAKVIGHITATAASALVKAGTTADVYSVNAATQAKITSLGGGGSLDQAYGALATTPGVVVPPGQMGWMQTVHIRGGDFDQIGYEFDGVPVLRSYDNYASTTASALGQQELQVYTGAAPADSQGQGLAGYINQVIKSGTYPGFADLDLGLGSPALYNKVNFEVGGATPNRNFSYYLGLGSYHQQFRYFDEDNGADIQSLWGTPFARSQPPDGCTTSAGAFTPDAANYSACYPNHIGPAGYVLGPPVDSVNASDVWDNENVLNLHFGVPHHNDTGKDDVQLLYDVSYLHNAFYSSASDWGIPGNAYYTALNGGPAFGYLSGPTFGWQYLGPVGTALPANITPSRLAGMINPVYFAYNPDSITSPFIPTNQRDGTANPNSIVKLQYQRNIGTNSYFRVYGYSDYSEWPQTCPDTGATNFIGYCPLNYYVSTRTNGVSASYANQINDQNQLNIELSDAEATDYRANDVTMINELEGLNPATGNDSFAYLVNAHAPTAGVCYTSTGSPVSCYSALADTVGLCAAGSQTTPGAPNSPCIFTGAGGLSATPSSCGSGPCEWFVAENGQDGGGNYAKPNFGAISVQDQWKPSSQLLFNLGLREDRFFYQLANTGGPAHDFWFNAWNNSYCVSSVPGNEPSYDPAGDAGAPSASDCAALGLVPATLTNLPNDTETFDVFQPRLGGTYTVNANNVLRFSAGRYTQAPNTAYEQYDLLQQDLAAYDGTNFWPVGFTTTTHDIRPPTSNNYDFSWEHHFGDSDVSFKMTPYLRQTQGQIQNFFLNQKTGFVSGLNAGDQTADGVEFELTKGDFNQNGVSGLLSLTYLHSYIRFTRLGTGGSVLSTINVAIQNYNSFTSGCASAAASNNPAAPCGSAGNANAKPTFVNPCTTAGCTGNVSVANPYYNAPMQPLLNVNADYVPFSTIPGGIEAASDGYENPLVGTFVLNFKHDKWAITPQFQYFEGSQYGDPLSGYGVDPSSCGGVLTSAISGDPRYPYGGTGSPFNALACSNDFAIPDPYTHAFDDLGAFRQPNQFLMHMQVSYDLSSRTSLVLNLANIINTCSGGTAAPWTQFANNKVCGYTLPGYAAPLPYGANIYNPGATMQPMVEFPYQENPTIQPFNAYLDLRVKL
jgi:hypothetical protein